MALLLALWLSLATPAAPVLTVRPRLGLAPLSIRAEARLRAPVQGDDVLRLELIEAESGVPVLASERDVQGPDQTTMVALETQLEPGEYQARACVRGAKRRCAVPVGVAVR